MVARIEVKRERNFVKGSRDLNPELTNSAGTPRHSSLPVILDSTWQGGTPPYSFSVGYEAFILPMFGAVKVPFSVHHVIFDILLTTDAAPAAL